MFFIPLLLARSPATTTAAVAQSLTTDCPVTQLNFHSFFLCMHHTPIHTLCVSFITPHHPLVSLLRCIEYSKHWNNIHACFNICTGDRTSDGKKFKYATTAVAGQDIIDVKPLCMLLLFFVRANTSCSIHVVAHTQCFLLSFSIYKYVVLPPLSHTFHHVPLSDGCRICSLWQQNDTIQKFCLCLISPRSFA